MPKSSVFWFSLSAVVLLLVGLWLIWWRWDWLHPEASTTVSNSETLRNVGLLLGGALAFVFAGWRAWVAERQASAAQAQAATAQAQFATAQAQVSIAQQSLLNERYQRGAEMLGTLTLAVRLGGIFALRRLAEEHPEQYHIQIMELFCAFARHPTKDSSIESGSNIHEEDNNERTLRADVQDVMRAIGTRSSAGLSLEHDHKITLYLRDARLDHLQVQDAILSGAWLTNANLSGAGLRGANLSSARLRQAILCGAKLQRAILSDAKLWGADLSGAVLLNANLSGTDLCGVDAISPEHKAPVRGLTQGQLDQTRADPNNLPKLDGVLDAETGEQLIWSGKPLDGGG